MKALVIYDSTGRIWNIVYGEETAPQGLTCMWVDIPEGAVLERIDVTDAEHPEAVFSYLPESDIGRLQAKVVEQGGRDRVLAGTAYRYPDGSLRTVRSQSCIAGGSDQYAACPLRALRGAGDERRR